MLYSISVGWNTKELERGIYRHGKARLLGGWGRPVETLNDDSGVNLLRDWITDFCDLQFNGEGAVVLHQRA